jgi:hypothetical protein
MCALSTRPPSLSQWAPPVHLTTTKAPYGAVGSRSASWHGGAGQASVGAARNCTWNVLTAPQGTACGAGTSGPASGRRCTMASSELGAPRVSGSHFWDKAGRRSRRRRYRTRLNQGCHSRSSGNSFVPGWPSCGVCSRRRRQLRRYEQYGSCWLTAYAAHPVLLDLTHPGSPPPAAGAQPPRALTLAPLALRPCQIANRVRQQFRML